MPRYVSYIAITLLYLSSVEAAFADGYFTWRYQQKKIDTPEEKYEKCLDNNRNNMLYFSHDTEEYCQEQSIRSFPKHYGKSDAREFAYQKGEKTYSITVKDEAKYPEKILSEMRNNFFELCSLEYERTRHNIEMTQKDCSLILE